jgi:hypothetical protein
VGSSYDLVGEASSYLRSGLSALLMFLPRVGRGIRDFADLRPGRRRGLIASRHSENGTVDMTRCNMFAGRSSRSKSPGGPPCDNANDVRDREEALELRSSITRKTRNACPRTIELRTRMPALVAHQGP